MAGETQVRPWELLDACTVADPVALAVGAVLLAGCSADKSGDEPLRASHCGLAERQCRPGLRDGAANETELPSGGRRRRAEESEPAVRAVSVLGLAEQRHRGDRLRLGAVRERTAEYTSYDVTYRSRTTTRKGEESYTITGVLNVPTGRGPFPAVVLAHGYIDPAIYERGQGMTRERGYLASRGYVALHVDYRNHAESDNDPLFQVRMRLGYSADVINAVKALRSSADVPVDDERMALFGRSMGGGVILKALIAEPGLVQAAAPWASVSSLEAENYDQFIRPDPEDSGLRDQLARRHGTPERARRFWRENSSRPYFDRITEPVLMVHGRFDDTCPPRWATATQRALTGGGRERPAAVVRRRARVRAGVQRCDGPDDSVLRPETGLLSATQEASLAANARRLDDAWCHLSDGSGGALGTVESDAGRVQSAGGKDPRPVEQPGHLRGRCLAVHDVGHAHRRQPDGTDRLLPAGCAPRHQDRPDSGRQRLERRVVARHLDDRAGLRHQVAQSDMFRRTRTRSPEPLPRQDRR